jgi:predicted Zn-ribbon and HTH transcriptional regulator
MSNIVQGWQCPLCKTVYSPLVQQCNCANEKANTTEQVNEKTAHWIVWGGWRGNHDQRIEDAKCSNCGFEHPTVYGSLKLLNSHCPRCNSKMSVSED